MTARSPGRAPVDPVDLALFGTMAVVYAGGWIAADVALRSIAPFGLASTRFIIAGAVLVLIARLRGEGLGLDRPWAILGIALIAQAFGHAVLYLGLAIAPVVDAVVLSTALTPVCATAFAVIYLRERIGRRGLAGTAIAITGALAIILPDSAGGVAGRLEGSILVAIGAAAVALYAGLGRAAMVTGSPTGVAGSSTLIAGLALLPLAVASGEVFDPGAWPVEALLAYAYLTVPSAILGAALYYTLVRRSGAVRATIVSYITPVATFALSTTLLAEPPDPIRLGGAAFAVLGTHLVLTDRRTGLVG